MDRMQCTIKDVVNYEGIGLHTGRKIALSLKPQEPNKGIVFIRTDLKDNPQIPATTEYIEDSNRGVTLKKGDVYIHTVEHLLSAIFGLGIDNIRIELSGSELPVGDGSALPYVKLIKEGGIVLQSESVKYREVSEPIWFFESSKGIMFLPDSSFKIDYIIQFDHPVIGLQSGRFCLTPDLFEKEIASARTFGFLEEVENLWQKGLAQGGNLSNTVVIAKESILNPEGLRFTDEPLRHKVLDLIGDLSLVGSGLKGHVLAIKSGHDLNIKLAKKLVSIHRRDK